MSAYRLLANVALRRSIEVLPIVFAMVFHAIAMQRWLLVAPGLAAVIYAVIRSPNASPKARSSSRQWYLVVIVGLLLGIVFPAADVSNGVLPPAAAAAMTGIAAVICVFAVFSGRLTVGWIAAWALVAMSGKRELLAELQFTLMGFLGTSLVAASLHAGVLKHRLREFMIWSMMVAAIASSTLVISMLINGADKFFLNTFDRLMVNQPKAATTGLSERITLGAKSTINPSRQPLLELSQLPGLLRVNVLDEFNDNQWTTSASLKTHLSRLEGLVQTGSQYGSIEMLFLNELDDSIPSPAGTLGVQHAAPRVEGGWVLRGSPDGVAMTLLVDPARQLPAESIVESDLLSVPDELRDSLAPLASQVVTDASNGKSNLDKAKSIASFFQANFQYSLTSDLSGEKHPLVMLIEERRPAYCIYFASAMALMLRTQGVPTRVVTGYAPGDVNSLTGRVIVRASDSHAWVEVWSPEGSRFVAFDPTPGDSRREIMGHNERPNILQSAALALRSNVRRLWLLMRYQPSTGIKALFVSPWLWLVIGGMLWIWKKRKRRTRMQLQTVIKLPIDMRLKGHYDRYVDMLRKAGIDPQPFETDDELLARLKLTGNDPLWTAARGFIGRYRAIRFGGVELDEAFEELKLLQ